MAGGAQRRVPRIIYYTKDIENVLGRNDAVETVGSAHEIHQSPLRLLRSDVPCMHSERCSKCDRRVVGLQGVSRLWCPETLDASILSGMAEVALETS